MKKMFNLSTSSDDMERFANQVELLDLLRGFDGVELLYCEEDQAGLIPPERVIGLHMSSFPNWLDFWKADETALLKEFGTRAVYEQYYGGRDRSALLTRFRQDLANAARYGAEYVVFHVSHATISEAISGRYRHSDEAVIEASCELLTELFEGQNEGPLLLLENLWQSGFRFTDPELTARLLQGIKYPNKGIMLDTGHLMHTNTKLRTQAEALSYIYHLLDEHGELCRHIRGVHLHQSLTGAFAEALRQNPPALKEDYRERNWQMFEYIFTLDQHRPFTCPGVGDLIKRIAPDYLTFEFISEDRDQHQSFLDEQTRALAVGDFS